MKRQIFALISAVSVALSSAACVTLLASADGSDYTVTADVMTEEWLSTNESIIAGKSVSVKNGNNSNETTTTLITDGKLGTDYTNWTVYSDFKPYDFTCELGGLYSISKIAFCGQSASGSPYFAGYTPKRVQIFLSNKKSDLYSGTPVIDYTVVNDQYNKTHSWLFDLKSSVNAKYIGLRVLETNPSGNTGDGPFKIEEFGVYGDSISDPGMSYTVKSGIVNTDWIESGSRVNALTYSSCRMIIPQLGYDSKKISDDGTVETIIANMSDGALGPTSRFDRWFTEQKYAMAGTTITYNLGYKAPVKQVMFAGDLTEKHWSPTKFSVYISENEADLYNQENRKISYTPENADVNSWVFTFNAGSIPSGKFIGFKLDGTNEMNVKIEELGAYIDLDSGFSVEKSNVTEEWFSSAEKKNLLENADVKIEAEGDMQGFTPVNGKGDALAEALVDENTDTLYEAPITGDYKPVRITYDLKTEKQAVQFMLASIKEKGVNAIPREIEIYVSNNTADLYDSKNRIIAYNNSDNGIGAEQFYDSSYAFRISADQSVKGRYIGFRILKPNGTDESNYLKISELGAYSEYIIPKTPLPVSNYTYGVEENAVTQEYVDSSTEQNLIRYSSIEKTDRKGNVLNDTDLSKLVDGTVYLGSDGNSSNDCYIYWMTGREEIRYTFDMMQSVAVDKIMFASFYNPNADFCTGLYAVYVSDNKSELYKNENCAVVWDNTGKYENKSDMHAGGNQIFTFSGNKPKGRYVGFAVLNSNPMDIHIRIEQLGVYADGVNPKNRDIADDAHYPYKISHNTVTQEYVTEHMLENMIMNSTPVFTEDKQGKAYPGLHAGKTERMTDGKIRSGTEYAWWLNEWETLRITYDMGKSVPINRILFVSRYLYYADTLTRNYEIYIGDNEETLYEERNRVVAYDNTGYYIGNRNEDCPGADQIFDFYDSKPTGRYVGFKIIDPDPYSLQTFGTSKFGGCSVAIDQIAVYSSGNKPGDPLYAQSFKDETTGAECFIRKLEFGDNFSGATSFKIEKIDVPNDVSEYISKNYLELADNAYRIILKDAAGNIMTADDLGNRKLEIHIPSMLVNDKGDTYLCQYKDVSMSNLKAYFSGKSIIALTDEPGDLYLLKNVFIEKLPNLVSVGWDPIEEISDVVIDDSPEEITVYNRETLTLDEKPRDTAKKNTKKIIKVIKRKRKAPEDSGLPLWAVIAIASGGVVLAGGTVTAVILIKKNKINKERGKGNE